MKKSGKEWLLRIAVLMLGLTIAHLGVTLFLLSDLGSDPFNVFVQGLYRTLDKLLDCDVVLGGFLSEYLQPYLPALRQYVTAGNPFMENADFVQMSRLPRHITTLGAALYFVRQFVASI